MSAPARRPGGFLHSHAPRFEAIAAPLVDRSPTTQIRPTCAPRDHDAQVFQSCSERPDPLRARFVSTPPLLLASLPDTGFEAPQSKPALLPGPTHPAHILPPSFPANPFSAKFCS